MFCTKCGYEYFNEAEKCPQCEAPNLHRTPPKSEKTKKAGKGCLIAAVAVPLFLVVAFFGSAVIAAIFAPRVEPVTDVNGNVVTTVAPPTETSTAPATTRPEQKIIKLKHAKLGKYGKIVRIGGFDSYWYFVPAGEYKVTFIKPDGIWQKVMVDKDVTTINQDGYEESVRVLRINYDPKMEVQTIKVSEGEHIKLTGNTEITLTLNE